MRKFDFTQLGGMPWYQNQFDFMQKAYQMPLESIAKLAGPGPVILHGIKETSPGTYSDGVIALNGEIIEFKGGAFQEIVVVNTYNTSLLFASGDSRSVMSRKEASFGTGAVQFSFSEIKPFQFGFGKSARSGWVELTIEGTPLTNQYLRYNYDPLSNNVNLKGAVRHQVLNTTDNPIQRQLSTLPEWLRPATTVYFNTALETHSTPPIIDIDGVTYKSEIGRVGPTGILSLSQRRLGSGVNTNFLHYFNFSYSLD